MKPKGFFPCCFIKYSFGVLVILHLKVDPVTCAQVCEFAGGKTETCDYGCCTNECCPYSVSTSVLIVAGIVGGLIVVALVVAIVICLVKTYRDKRAARVRQLRPGHNHVEDNIPRRPAVPRKPPEYTEQPPPYSSEMPESHYRPVTVNANYFNYNTRYRTPAMQNYPQNHATNSGNVNGSQANQNNAGTRTRRTGVSGLPGSNNQQSDAQLPGAPMPERPPTYTEQSNAEPAEAQRRRRFIQTPPRGPVVVGGSDTALRTVSELTSSESSAIDDEQSDTRQSSLTTQTMSHNVSGVVISRRMNIVNQNTTNGTSVTNTQSSGPNDAVIIGQEQSQRDLNGLQNAPAPQTQRSTVIGQTGQRVTSSLETAVSLARNRQAVRTVTPHSNQVTPRSSQRHQAVSVRPNLRTTSEVNTADIEELACL